MKTGKIKTVVTVVSIAFLLTACGKSGAQKHAEEMRRLNIEAQQKKAAADRAHEIVMQQNRLRSEQEAAAKTARIAAEGAKAAAAIAAKARIAAAKHNKETVGTVIVWFVPALLVAVITWAIVRMMDSSRKKDVAILQERTNQARVIIDAAASTDMNAEERSKFLLSVARELNQSPKLISST